MAQPICLEQLLAAAPRPRSICRPRRGGVIEQIPLDHVEIALGDLLAVAVAVGVVEADAGAGRALRSPRSLPAAVTNCWAPALETRARPSPCGLVKFVGSHACRPEWMSNGVEREGPQRGRHRRRNGDVQVAEAEHLHLDGVAGHAGRVQAGRQGQSLAVLVHEDRGRRPD